jgi:hypothetical protein
MIFTSRVIYVYISAFFGQSQRLFQDFELMDCFLLGAYPSIFSWLYHFYVINKLIYKAVMLCNTGEVY